MRKFIAAGLLAVASFGVPTAQASSLNFFTSFWVLGDSLSDPGNFYAASGDQYPPAPYFEGRFSNGPVWAEHVAADFEAADLPTGNFAHGFAKAFPFPGVPDPLAQFVVDLPGQIELFASASAGKLGSRPLVSMLFGPNDIGYAGVQLGMGAEFGALAANSVANAALALKELGVNDVLLFTIPPLDLIPAFALLSPPSWTEQAKLGTEAFNSTLVNRIGGLEAAGVNVLTVDLYGLFFELIDDPLQFGVLNATLPCYVLPFYGGQGFNPPCSAENAPLFAFWDQSHPNNVIHAQIAGIVQQQVAPVPLPAAALLLVGGIAGLGLMRRRAA
jgi:outer membrane lipase/esterase